MQKKRPQGFTLIELLVVIAIIGILSSVVLASLNSARGKGANAAVKANLSGIRAAAELFYDNNSFAYTGLCASVAAALAAADAAGGGGNKCHADADSWVAVTELKVTEGTFTGFCVDSNGASKGVTSSQDTAITNANTLCP